jgi:hypothetical protein
MGDRRALVLECANLAIMWNKCFSRYICCMLHVRRAVTSGSATVFTVAEFILRLIYLLDAYVTVSLLYRPAR